MKDPCKQKFMADCLGKAICHEIRNFCSANEIMLKGNTRDDLIDFSFTSICLQATNHMPILTKLLGWCLKTRTERQNWKAVTSVIISIIIKHRRPQLCILQKVLSLLLYSGRSSKKVRYHVTLLCGVCVCVWGTA